jgi:catechol 2,3-dioxygenase-like lactoylglutathione lyase family enzyme
MISHVFLGTNDPERAARFYRPVLARLGWRERFTSEERGWTLWEPIRGARPLIGVGRPYNGNNAVPANGTMVALDATTRRSVDDTYLAAMAMGALDEGAPSLRPEYHPNYYGLKRPGFCGGSYL